jgi:hypothetical protein
MSRQTVWNISPSILVGVEAENQRIVELIKKACEESRYEACWHNKALELLKLDTDGAVEYVTKELVAKYHQQESSVEKSESIESIESVEPEEAEY